MNTTNLIIIKGESFTIKLDQIKNKKAIYILRAINHPLRLQMIELLNEKKSLTVTEIYQTLQIQQAIASQNLAVLRRAGFVKTKKESKYVHYMLSYQYFNHFTKNINQLFEEV